MIIFMEFWQEREKDWGFSSITNMIGVKSDDDGFFS
jgi:hypothetical protein